MPKCQLTCGVPEKGPQLLLGLGVGLQSLPTAVALHATARAEGPANGPAGVQRWATSSWPLPVLSVPQLPLHATSRCCLPTVCGHRACSHSPVPTSPRTQLSLAVFSAGSRETEDVALHHLTRHPRVTVLFLFTKNPGT